ncbi:MAG: 4Fe-4S binding protein [Firmicutes bacterium]|jgi:NAD-dependent dihydropyrimidine dehydrogenase PreA subunit|nr:4Fe-4S binding protein [Bacillota bacterium]
MSKNWYPVISQEECTECGSCVEKCSHGVYEVGVKKPIIVNPDECVDGCRGCQNICPSGAISYFGDTGQEVSACGCCSCS